MSDCCAKFEENPLSSYLAINERLPGARIAHLAPAYFEELEENNYTHIDLRGT